MINENYKITLKKEMNYLTLLQELLGFFLVANDETRRNVNSLIKVKQTRTNCSRKVREIESGS